MYPFTVCDCSLARSAVGQSCSNLRELLTAVRGAPEEVLEHHMMRCPLQDYFEFDEFPNDFARWCWNALGDRVVAGGHFLNLGQLRRELIEVFRKRLLQTALA